MTFLITWLNLHSSLVITLLDFKVKIVSETLNVKKKKKKRLLQ